MNSRRGIVGIRGKKLVVLKFRSGFPLRREQTTETAVGRKVASPQIVGSQG